MLLGAAHRPCPGKVKPKVGATTSGLTILKGVFLGVQIEKERKEKKNVFFWGGGFHPPSVKPMPMIQ